MKKFVIVFLVLGSFLSCQQPFESKTTTKATWTRVPELSYYTNIVLNTYSSDNELFYITPESIGTVGMNYEINGFVIPWNSSPPHLQQPLINKTFFVMLGEDQLLFQYRKQTNQAGSWPFFYSLKFSEIVNDTSVKYFLTSKYRTIGAISESNTILISLSKTSPTSIYDNDYYLIHLEGALDQYGYPITDGNGRINLTIKKVDTSLLPEVVGTGLTGYGYTQIQGFKDSFLITFLGGAQGTFRILEDGSLQKVLDDSLCNYFMYKGLYYGYSSNDKASSYLYSSTDGITWNQISDYSVSSGIKFITVDSKLIGYSYDQMTLNDIELNKVTILDNSGLDGKYITSIGMVGNRVYVSTISGLFFKEKSDFLTPK